MAKWGEGDPRWLVQHRDDGKNVNGWHWEEKNKFEWSKQRLTELLTGLKFEQAAHQVNIISVKECTGEAAITTRKGNKKFAVYDLKLTLQWECCEVAGSEKAKGEIKIHEFASTVEPDEYVFEVTVDGSGNIQDTSRKVVEQLRGQLTDVLGTFVLEINQF